MKVLWFTNIPMPAMLGVQERDHAGSGSWMVALLKRLARVPDMQIAVACAAPGLAGSEIASSDNLQYYPISQGPAWRLFDFRPPDNDSRHLVACAEVVRRVNPDIIHIHGTERFYGLLGAQNLTTIPLVISLQGLLHEYARLRHYFGVTQFRDIIALQDPVNLFRWMGPFPEYAHFCRAAKRELEILRGNRWFMGRSLWDRAHLMAVNPTARYFHVPEMLRTSFHQSQWDIASCTRHQIIFTNANTFRRGAEMLLDAVTILREDFPGISLALAGGVEELPYGKRLQRRISLLGLNDAVQFLGKLNEKRMTTELCKAHVFVIPSLLENSPNSLCEAQLVGLPCVASYCGGIPSLVEEGQTGLLFTAGDATVLAERIRELFVDDHLARKLGAQARQTALTRHDPETVTRTVMKTYESVIREASGT
jgi:L-malate glycosyltransferase